MRDGYILSYSAFYNPMHLEALFPELYRITITITTIRLNGAMESCSRETPSHKATTVRAVILRRPTNPLTHNPATSRNIEGTFRGLEGHVLCHTDIPHTDIPHRG